MEIELVSYSDKLKQSVFSFTNAVFYELGKKFEPEGRHAFYNDIENSFIVFFLPDSRDGYCDRYRGIEEIR